MERKNIVVIGSGIGGAGAASILQSRGHEVVLLERSPFAGGKCWGFEKDGFIVDSGVHMFSMGPNGPHGEINRMVGGGLEWLKGNPGCAFHMRGSFDMMYYQSQKDPRGQLEMLKSAVNEYAYLKKNGPVATDSSRARIKKASNELHGASRRGGAGELIKTFKKIVRRDTRFMCDLDELTTFEFLSGITDNELLHQNIAVCSTILLVIPYTMSSAAELMWCVSSMFEREYLSVPRGGSREIPNSWLRSFARNGGKLVLGAEVGKVLLEDGSATGVVTTDGNEYKADAVISNAGIKRTIEMTGEGAFPVDYVKNAGELKESYSFITVKYGLSRNVVEAKAPCFFNIPNIDPVTMFDYVEQGGVPNDPFLFVPIPSEWDRHAAPLGKQLIMMGVPGPTVVSDQTVEQCERILDRGEQRLFELFPAMEKNIQWKMRTHIRHTGELTGKPTGECIGLAQSVGQTGVHKPSCKTPVEGLYLVGCDAGARGVGTEQAASSAIYVSSLME